MEMDTRWFGAKDDPNPVRGTVEEVRNEGSASKPQYVLYAVTALGRRKLSLWGENQQRCMTAWTKEESTWKGKNFSLLTEEKPGEKRKRILTPA